MKKTYLEQIKEASDVLQKKLGDFKPEIGMVLGSGLSEIADLFKDPIIIKFSDIPNWPVSTFDADPKKMVIVAGTLNGRRVLTTKYRTHFYEGYSMKEITFPIRIMQMIGIKNLLLTNAAGGINKKFRIGDLMVITDHINFSGTNPLIGYNHKELGVRFPDCSDVYDKEINKKVLQKCKEMEEKKEISRVQKGVYLMTTGPSYETPSEIKMFRKWGGDAVGMSTVPEAIVARHGGIKCTGISLVTNMAAGVLDVKLGHEEVTREAAKKRSEFKKIIFEILPLLVNKD